MIKDLTYCDSVTHHCPSASVPDSAQLVSALSGTEVMCTSMYKVHTLLFLFSLTLPRPIQKLTRMSIQNYFRMFFRRYFE